MRALVTADTAGGVWTYAIDLARGLAEREVEVVLAVMGPPLADAQRNRVARTPGVKIFDGAFRLEWMDQPWDDVDRAGRWLVGLAERFAPDVVHLNTFAHGALDFGVPRLVVGHSCVCSWWRAVHGTEPPGEWDEYRRRVRAGLQAAERVAAPTRAMLDELAAFYGPLPPSRVIWNGRQADLFAPRAKEPLVFSAGRLWDEAKNLAALEAAAPLLPWPVYVAGATRRPDGPGEDVHFEHAHPVGTLSTRAMAAWFGRAAIYALPARYEPFGLSVLEAALSGCALVLGDVSSLREVWDGAARFVPPGDSRALAAAITELAEDAEGREELAADSTRRARELSADRMAEGYLDLYREMSGHRDAAPAESPANTPAIAGSTPPESSGGPDPVAAIAV
ncbi:MAG TPA: glycosyltransferase family 4 protein [Thermoanaerobaculia bacterium]|nr:glycosyltransferase family 4 protein [Thermoanaerobaculia bacterium]